MYIEEMNVCKAHPFFCLLTLLVNKKNVTLKRDCVSTAMEIVKKRERVFEDDVFMENTCLGNGSKKRKTKFTHGRSFTHVTWFSWPMVSRD